METKKGYDKAKQGYGGNTSDYSPNAGEGHMNYTSSGSSKGGLAAGVQDGLAHVDSASDVKDLEGVTDNQRPEGRRVSVGKGMVWGS